MTTAYLTIFGLNTPADSDCYGLRDFVLSLAGAGDAAAFFAFDDPQLLAHVNAAAVGFDRVVLAGHSHGGAAVKWILDQWVTGNNVADLAVFFDPAPEVPHFGQFFEWQAADASLKNRWHVPQAVCRAALCIYQRNEIIVPGLVGVCGVPFAPMPLLVPDSVCVQGAPPPPLGGAVQNYNVTGWGLYHCHMLGDPRVQALVREFLGAAPVAGKANPYEPHPLEKHLRSRICRRPAGLVGGVRENVTVVDARVVKLAGAAAPQIKQLSLTAIANAGNTIRGTLKPGPMLRSAINQGQLSDCYLLATILAIILIDPNYFDNRIIIPVTLADGTPGCVLQFYEANTNTIVQITMSLQVSTSYDNPADGDIRPELLEKGYGFFRSGVADYLKDDFGTGTEAGQATGFKPFSAMQANQVPSQFIAGNRQAGNLVTVITAPTARTLVPSHCYAGESAADLINPWYGDQDLPFQDATLRSASEVSAIYALSPSIPPIIAAVAPPPPPVTPPAPPPAPPVINLFAATPLSMKSSVGGSLSFSVHSTASCLITIDAILGSGSTTRIYSETLPAPATAIINGRPIAVKPSASTEYLITATNAGGSVQRHISVFAS